MRSYIINYILDRIEYAKNGEVCKDKNGGNKCGLEEKKNNKNWCWTTIDKSEWEYCNYTSKKNQS